MMTSVEVVPMALVSVVFGLIFASAEAWKRLFQPDAEQTRKMVHILGGLTCSVFPFLFKNPLSVFILCALFVGIIVAGKKLGTMKAVHDVERKSEGAWCFPVAISSIFWLSHGHPVFYLISILVLTFADGFAALAGQSYGVYSFDVESNSKTIEGSIVFWAVTFLCIHIPLLLMTPIGRAESILVALIISCLVTGIESISFRGLDNLFIPFLTFYVLSKMTPKPLTELYHQVGILAIITLGAFLFRMRSSVLKGSAPVGLILLLYGSWSLCDIRWFWPLLLAALGLKSLTLIESNQAKEPKPQMGVQRFFLTGLIPFVLIFISNSMNNYVALYQAFQGCVLTLSFILGVLILRNIRGGSRFLIIAAIYIFLLPLVVGPSFIFTPADWPLHLANVILSSITGGLFYLVINHRFYKPEGALPPAWYLSASAAIAALVGISLSQIGM